MRYYKLITAPKYLYAGHCRAFQKSPLDSSYWIPDSGFQLAGKFCQK